MSARLTDHGFFSLVGLAVLPLMSSPAQAGDGVVELNQTCAVQTGCVQGDAPGFPITLNASGSYRLTSNLQVPNHNTNGIEVGAVDITVDFNGFRLAGPNTVTIPGLNCSSGGTGVGILATGPADGFVALNGRVRGMGSSGISLPSAQAVRIERIALQENCGRALEVGTASVISQVQSRGNAGDGIRVNFGGLVRDSVVEWNRDLGIAAGANSVVANNVVGSNGHHGIELVSGPGGLVVANSVSGSGWNFVTLGVQGSGIVARRGGTVLFNTSTANGGSGVSASSLIPPEITGVGFNTNNGNVQGGSVGGLVIGCSTTNSTVACP